MESHLVLGEEEREERERVPQSLATCQCGLGSVIFLFPSLFQIL